MKKLDNNKITIALIFIILVFAHCLFRINTADDIFFKNIELSNIFTWLGTRYNEWSSRLIIEFIMVILLHLPAIIWYILDSLMILLVAYSISYLFTKNTMRDKILSLVLTCIYPFFEMGGAGWYATTINYLWPMACGLFSLTAIKNVLDGKKEKLWMYPLYSLALLVACNQEQMCALIFGFYLIFIIYMIKEKQNNKFLIFQFLLVVMSLIFILTCPGNNLRNIVETARWYPEFTSLTLVEKSILGILTTVAMNIMNLKIPFILLIILIPFLLRKNNNVFIKINSFIPLIIVGILNIFSNIFQQFYSSITGIITGFRSFIIGASAINLHSMNTIVVLLIAIIMILSISLSLYFIMKEKDEKLQYLLPIIFLAGLASRVIMGFSPTVFESGVRTFLFYDFSIIICILVLITRCFDNKKINDITTWFGLLAIFQICNTIILSRI